MLVRLLRLRGLTPTVFERDANAGDRPQGGSLDLHGNTGQRAMKLARLENEFAAAARPEDQGDRLYDEAPRPSTLVGVTRLSNPHFLIEIDLLAVAST
jgi:hypothetical protein